MPAFTDNPRRINSASRPSGRIASRAVRRCAVSCARHVQGSGQTHSGWFECVRQVPANGRGPPSRCTVGRPTRVVDHVDSGVLVASRIRFNNIPAEQRKYLVKACVSAQVGIVKVRVAAVTEPDVRRHQRQSGFIGVLNAIVVEVKEGLGVQICLPLVHGNRTHIRASASQTDGRR